MKDLKPTFDLICLQILDRLAGKLDVIFLTDTYQKQSIKSQERLRRGTSDKFVVEGVHQRKHAGFKLFLQNDENKMQLVTMLDRVWGSHADRGKSVEWKKSDACKQREVLRMKSDDAEKVTVEMYELIEPGGN